MNVVGCKWVFKKKRGVDGSVQRCKARLVAKGYTQEYGDYHEMFAPTLKYKSLRLMLALSISSNIIIEQLDVKTAFLNADIHEDIYIDICDTYEFKSQNHASLAIEIALIL